MLTFILIFYSGVIIAQNAIGTMVQLTTYRASTIWFVKLDKDQDLLDVDSVIKSNYNKGGQVYLTNIKDGKYAMVAAQFEAMGRRTTYFNKDLILQSIVEVDSDEFLFTGKWIVKLRTMVGKEKKGDEISQHFFKILTGNIKKTSLGNQLLSGKSHYRGEFKDFQRSAQIIYDFKERALRHYKKEKLWYDKIKEIQ